MIGTGGCMCGDSHQMMSPTQKYGYYIFGIVGEKWRCVAFMWMATIGYQSEHAPPNHHSAQGSEKRLLPVSKTAFQSVRTVSAPSLLCDPAAKLPSHVVKYFIMLFVIVKHFFFVESILSIASGSFLLSHDVQKKRRQPSPVTNKI